MARRDSPDSTELTLSTDPADRTEQADATEPIDKIEPAEPIDKIDPAEPIDRIEPVDPMDRMEPVEPAARVLPSGRAMLTPAGSVGPAGGGLEHLGVLATVVLGQHDAGLTGPVRDGALAYLAAQYRKLGDSYRKAGGR